MKAVSLNINRYYLTLSALVVIAVIVALTNYNVKVPRFIAVVTGGVLSVLWVPSFRATELRSTPEPRWHYMLEESRARC